MTELNCRLATEADLAALCQFYQDICAHQKDDQFGADWHKRKRHRGSNCTKAGRGWHQGRQDRFSRHLDCG